MKLSREFSTCANVGRRRSLRALLFPMLLLSLAGFVQASRIRSLNLEEMTARADRVFHGRCTDVRVALDPALGQTVTWVTFVPERAVKGQARGRITMKVLGNQSASARPAEATEGIPRFEVGEDVVVFLYPDSQRGLTSPVGFGQGIFRIVKDKAGHVAATNQFGNEGLFDRLSRGAQARLGDRAAQYRGKRGVHPDDLLEMVRSLEK